MSKSKGNKNLVLTLFGNRPQVGEYELHPLTAGRIALLEEKGNALFSGSLKEGETVESFDVFEAFLVSISSGEELAELSQDDEEWKRSVRAFGFDLQDEKRGLPVGGFVQVQGILQFHRRSQGLLSHVHDQVEGPGQGHIFVFQDVGKIQNSRSRGTESGLHPFIFRIIDRGQVLEHTLALRFGDGQAMQVGF